MHFQKLDCKTTDDIKTILQDVMFLSHAVNLSICKISQSEKMGTRSTAACKHCLVSQNELCRTKFAKTEHGAVKYFYHFKLPLRRRVKDLRALKGLGAICVAQMFALEIPQLS